MRTDWSTIECQETFELLSDCWCFLLFYYPGQKKEPSLRFAARRTLFHVWYHARSQAISAGQGPIRDCPRLLPCADRAWSSMISHVEQRSSRRESRRWFFFLARVVEESTGQEIAIECSKLTCFAKVKVRHGSRAVRSTIEVGRCPS